MYILGQKNMFISRNADVKVEKTYRKYLERKTVWKCMSMRSWVKKIMKTLKHGDIVFWEKKVIIY